METAIPFSWTHLSWALILGGLSAVSLPMGSLFGIYFKPKSSITGMMAAFGAGALIAALSIELVAPTVEHMSHARNPHEYREALLHFLSMISGAVVGGILFVILDQIVNAKGGFLRKTAYTIAHFTTRKQERNRRLLQDLGSISLLRNVPAELVQQLVDCVKPIQFQRGEVIFDEGTHGDRLYFIQSGEVELFQNDQPFKKLNAGDTLGEIALLTEGPRTAKAKAETLVTALQLTKSDFDALRTESPELDRVTRQLASSRIEELTSHKEAQVFAANQWAKEASKALRAGQVVPSSDEIKKAAEEHSGAPLAIWLGIMLDGIPESFVIGTGFLTILAAKMGMHHNGTLGFTDVIPYTLIAGLFLSNFPEAMSSSVGMRHQGLSSFKVFFLWFTLMVMTAVGAAGGYLFGEALPHSVVIATEGLAAGAMLTMIASAMIPEAVHLGGSNSVGISTLCGFLSAIFFAIFE